MYALAERPISCFEKIVLKIGILLVAIAIFSGQNMSISAYSAGTLLRGYIVKEHSNNALFLLQQSKKNDIIK